MATTQNASIDIRATANASKDGRATTGFITTSIQLADGTIVNTADKCYYKLHTIAYSSTPENLDFAGGGLIDLNGETITWAEIVFLAVKASSANTVNILVGAHANPIDFGTGATAISVRPGETKVLICNALDPAHVVTAGSADGLKLATASGINQIVEVLAIGRSV